MDKLWIFTTYIVASSLVLIVAAIVLAFWLSKSQSKNKYDGINK